MTEEELKQAIEEIYNNVPTPDYKGYTIYMGAEFKKMFDRALKNACIPRDPKTGRFIKYKK